MLIKLQNTEIDFWKIYCVVSCLDVFLSPHSMYNVYMCICTLNIAKLSLQTTP